MKYVKLIPALAVLALMLLGGWWIARGPARRPPPAEVAVDRLRVITYNVQFLPLPYLNKRPNAPYRAAALGKILADYDIVGLNEVFASARRTQIVESLKQAWGAEFHCVTSGKGETSPLGFDSGLVLATRLPVVESHTLVYGNDSPMFEKGVTGDGFVAKGALHARLLRSKAGHEDLLIDCFITHLESVHSGRREEQYKKLSAFIREHSGADRPVLLLGDLNTVGDAAQVADPQSQYRRMWNTLTAARPDWHDLGLLGDAGKRGTSEPEAADGGQRIDYILFSNALDSGARRGPQLRAVRVEAKAFPDPQVKFLSDHCALDADLDILAKEGTGE